MSITGLLIKWYADNNGVSQGVSLFIATAAIVLVGVLKIINSDLMKPTFDDLLNAPSSSPMTSTHMNYMMNPVIMVLDKIFEKFFPGLDKYDFDAAKLNKKIGFWDSKFFIGFILGIVIGIMGTPHPIAGVEDADKWRLVIRGWLSLGWTIGNTTTGDIKAILGAVVFLVFYIGIFAWYRKQMIKRNEEYAAKAK